MRLPEAIVSAANGDAALASLLPGGVWFGQADDDALQHPAYGEVVLLAERREATFGRGVRDHIVDCRWGVALYSVDPERAEEARDAWYARFRPAPDAPPPPAVEDGSGLSWWCEGGNHAQDNDQISSGGDPVYVRTLILRTRHSVSYPRGN